MYTHIIFDIDGTLLDSGEVVVDALMRVSEELICDAASEDVCRKTLAMNTRVALRHIGISEQFMEKAINRYNELYASGFHVRMFPGIIDALKQLKQRQLHLGILSAREEYEFEIDPSFAILKPYFSVLMGANYAEPKPSPKSLLRYIEKHHAVASEILYIGDTDMDSLTAEKAGVTFALAGWNASVDETVISHQYIFKHPDEIVQLVDGFQKDIWVVR